MNHEPSTMNKVVATMLLITFATTFYVPNNAYAGGGNPSAGGGGLPGPMRAIESFQPDLSTGRATMGIPIAVPPGRHGVQPAVGLSYSSSGKNGLAGVGWDLALGSIERSTRRGVPKFDSTDTFILKFGGVSADLGEISPGEFRMIDEQLFAKILFNSTTWTLTLKDGTVATFGAAPNSQLVVLKGTAAWFLNQVKDIHGNTMSFTYTTLNRQVYPSSILYTAHPATGLSAQNEVRFTWESRPDPISDLMFGESVDTTQRFSKIETFNQGGLVKRWAFGYTTSSRSGRSLLTQVTTYGSDGTTPLPSTRFNYSSETLPSYPRDAVTVFPLPFVGDFNGDGKADYCFYSNNGMWEVALSIGDRFQPKSLWLYSFGSDSEIPVFGNFSGSNYTDAILYVPASGLIRSVFSDGASRFTPTWESSLPAQETPIAGDFNGDGLTDIGTFNSSTGRWTISLCRDANRPPLPPSTWLSGAGQNSQILIGDFNGDGLTDIGTLAGSSVNIALSNGSQFQLKGTWYNGVVSGRQYIAADMNGDGITDLAYLNSSADKMGIIPCTGSGFSSATEVPFFANLSNPIFRAADYNGDGLSDPEIYLPHSQEMGIARSSGTVTDLLTSVDNGVGGTTTIAYQPSTIYDNRGPDGIPRLPFPAQTVSSQTVSNGMGWSAATQYTYSGGWFSSADREFLGFAYAKVTDPQNNTAESWFHQDTHLKGHPFKQQTRDSSGNLYAQVDNAWACTSLFPLPNGHIHFCHLASTTATVYDGDSTFKQTRASYTYDSYGNVISQVQEGDTSVSGDEITTTTDYTLNPTLWLMGFPSHAVVTDASGNKLSESWITYDGNAAFANPPTKGDVTQTESWLSTGGNPVSKATYDAYGNKLTSTDPLNRTTTTTYDSQATFPIQVKNSLGHTLSTTYDPGTGNILTTTDPNNQTTTHSYDALGRLLKVIGPNDAASSPGVTYAYDLSSVPTRITKQVKASASGTYYTSYAFADGLGRTIQARSPAKDPAKQIVTGNVEFGTRGQVAAQYLPYLAASSSSYSPPASDAAKTRYQYDPVGRMIQVTEPDGAITKTSYNDWTVTLTDAKGSITIKESDAYGRLAKVTESATVDHPAATTLYTYDPLGRLTKVTDAVGNITTMSYDSLGRKLTMTDPDMGAWSYAYDATGNLIKQTDAKGQILEFTCDVLNRLTTKKGRSSAGSSPTTLATYTYDVTSKPNCLGRLSKVTDTSGSTEFFYDNLGREIKTIKTVGSSVFVVQREYDPLNRLTRLIYPDNTDLRYDYSPQGMNRIYSVNADSSTIDYLTNADFNAAGETLKLQLGNGVTTDYNYDPQTLRIASIHTQNAASQTLQDMAYTFDSVGNLANLTDRWNSATQSFQYDALNRLTGANGSYGAWAYRFDALGNLVSKDNGMTLTYGPTNAKPHAVTKCTEPGKPAVNLTYDANGNLTKKRGQTFIYDVQNRLTKVVTPGGQPGTVTLTLRPGWNAVGFPFDFKDYSSTEVLRSLTFNTDYDQLVKPSVTATPPTPPSTGAGSITLEFGKGFWIHVPGTSSVALTVSGTTPYPKRTLSLAKGWNAVAVPTLVAKTLSETLSGLVSGTDYSQVQRWNASTQAFETLTLSSTVSAGETLWINILKKAKTWTYPTATKNTTTSYTYDGDGGRVKMTTNEGGFGTYVGEMYEALPNSVTRTHIFFGPTRLCTLERNPLLIASVSPNSSLLTPNFLRRAYASLKRIFQGIEETFVGTCYADIPLPANTKLIFFHGDHLGSVNVVTDHTGKQLELSEYQPYGSFARKEGNRSLSTTSSRSAPSYTGKRLDASTGLYYYGARYFDPELGRFTQPDTIVQSPSDPQTLNRYTYVRNNPLIYTDPTGHSWKSFWKKAAGILITVAVGALTFGLGAPLALAIGIGAFVGTTSGAIINGVPVGKAFALGAVAGLAGGLGANFAIGAGFWGGMGIGAAFGAAGGAASAAILGGNPLRGALAGGIGGGIMGAAGGALGKSAMTAGMKFGLGTAAASGAGASSSAIAGGNAGEGALLGAMGAITSAVAYSIASSNLQQAIDAGRAGGRSEADGVVAVNMYNRKLDGGLPGELLGRVHVVGEIAGEGTFFEMSNIGNKIHVYEGPLSAMTVATQKYIATGPSPDVTFTAYRSQVTAALASYGAAHENTNYNFGTENSLMFANYVRRSSEVE